MVVASLLSLVVGAVLGLLGGGGSILMVPLLTYGLHLPPKEAIASSLVVVGFSAAIALIPHLRQGAVRWRAGLLFALFGSAGAWLGGLAASWFSGTTLLLLFGVVMVLAAGAMLSGGGHEVEERSPGSSSLPLLAPVGLLVGGVSGLVGAGGGFLVVPALALLGGMSMGDAVGTSLLVIALNSAAGYAGHAAHVDVDWALTVSVAVAAALGSLVGAKIGTRLSAVSLKRLFAYFVLVMAAILFRQELTTPMTQAIFVEPWPFWAGGVAIGLIVLLFAALEHRLLGISTGYADACTAVTDAEARSSWRLPLVAGVVVGGALAALMGGAWVPTLDMGGFDRVLSDAPLVKLPVFLIGGMFVGFGARLAGGCTSGHSIVGVALRAPSSLLATATFLITGFVTTQILFAVGTLR